MIGTSETIIQTSLDVKVLTELIDGLDAVGADVEVGDVVIEITTNFDKIAEQLCVSLSSAKDVKPNIILRI